MMMERPDLTDATTTIVEYIEALEAELATLRAQPSSRRNEEPLEPSEPPTTVNLITISADGMAKRTPRHLYYRQNRGGMGVFDIEVSQDDAPAFLVQADESAGLIIVTDQARAFRLPVRQIFKGEVRSRGRALQEHLTLRDGEHIAVALADSGGSHVALVSQRGQLRRVAERYFGPNLQSGTVLYDVSAGGAPAAACWTTGEDDLFIATRSGRAIRFAERLAPIRGCLGMRVDPRDAVVGIAAAGVGDGVFLFSDDGKGTIRLMTGFAANKSPGSSGKVAMRTENLVGVCGIRMATVDETDLFAISELGKLIRFPATDVPPKEGVVQGVNCMNLRSDQCVALTSSAG